MTWSFFDVLKKTVLGLVGFTAAIALIVALLVNFLGTPVYVQPGGTEVSGVYLP